MGTDPSTIAVEDNTPQDSTINKYARIRQQNKPNKVVPTEKFKTMNYMNKSKTIRTFYLLKS